MVQSADLVGLKREVISKCLEQGILLGPDIIQNINCNLDINNFLGFISGKTQDSELLLCNEKVLGFLNEQEKINWFDFERFRSLYEQGKDKKAYLNFLEVLKKEKKEKRDDKVTPEDSNVQVVFSYDKPSIKKDVQAFITYYNLRYTAIKNILQHRHEMQDTTSINKLQNRRERGQVSLIGIVKEKITTPNNNFMFVLEDPTGCINVLVNKNRAELYNLAREIVLDDTIGIVGMSGDNIVFANSITLPDIPLNKELKKAKDEIYAVFLSDLHVGSDKFLPDQFNKFLSWINGEVGGESQRQIVDKIKYLFIIGDLVDGVGIYPDQDSELEIKDIYEQYEECARLLKRIPERIKLIICPGNHDAMRITEPQPKLYKDFAKAIWDLPNAILVSNPSLINIHSSKDFPGFDVLMYHGYSFDYFISEVDPIREQGGYDRADLVMKFLLQRRHLSPSHTATLYIPDVENDPLVIEKVPDFFVTGHIHKTAAANYRNITMICGSCWQGKTTFQEKVGHHPEPARVPIVNLQTRQVKILRF